MDRLTLYSYDPKNLEQIVETISVTRQSITIWTAQSIIENLKRDRDDDEPLLRFDYDYNDISLIIGGDSERSDVWSNSLITLFSNYLLQRKENEIEKCFIVDKKHAKNIASTLPYFISEVKSLEQAFELDKRIITNIVDIDSASVNRLEEYLESHLFGNTKFRKRLIQELKRFRLFNSIGERKVFSAFVCGPSGIGKTLTAKLLHDFLAPQEKYIKINLGNYSDHNALSSLIGSPRGYVGSSKGELSSKIEESKSTVILIDEFEKASREVHNFFLELLSDGRFTDSQGREFDLNKYIIIFTSNIGEADLQATITPELRSRFDLMYKMVLLTNEEKKQYVRYKANYYLEKINAAYGIRISIEDIEHMVKHKIAQLDNIRLITREIELCVSSIVEEKLSDTVAKYGE